MGQKLTQSKIVPNVEKYLARNHQNFQFIQLVGNGLMTKTAVVEDTKDHYPMLLKIFFKLSKDDKDKYKQEIKKVDNIFQLFQTTKLHNIAPILHIIDNDNLCIVVREFFQHNLKERIFCKPYLSQIEKIWISFQILFGVYELHSNNQYHGDLKLENVVLTSYGSVYLTDLAPFKPVYIKKDDSLSYTYYFGSNNNIAKSCNIAPERLIDKKTDEGTPEQVEEFDLKMDVFSVGAIIAELFLEESVFDYSKMLGYKKGDFSTKEPLSRIQNEKLRTIIEKMIDLNPENRPTIKEALQYFADEICPITIPKCILQFNALINLTSYWKPDMLIGAHYKHWIQIWKVLFGPKKEVPLLCQKLNAPILNKLILKPSFPMILEPNEDKLSLRGFDFILDKDDYSKLVNEDNLSKEVFTNNSNSKCVILFVNYLLQALPNVKYESSVLVGMEMLKNFCKEVSDLTKISYIIPYFVSLLDRKSILTSLTALNYIIEILYMINFDELTVSEVYYNFFDSYIFQSIVRLRSKGDTKITLEFINVIDKLIDLQNKFLAVVNRSRIKKLEESMNTPHIEKKEEKKEEVNTITQNPAIPPPPDAVAVERKKKLDEINAKNEAQVNQFRTTLIQIVFELLGKNDEVDVNQMLIRKIESLIDFYGKKECTDFSKFIINWVNKKEWIIQKELVKVIPNLIKKIGDANSISYIMICLETFASNNLNEFKIEYLIKTIYELLQNGYINQIKATKIIREMCHFIVHPNYKIREGVINLLKLLLTKLSHFEAFTYLYPVITPYLTFPAPLIRYETIEKTSKPRISRVLLNLKLLKIAHDFKINPEDEDVLNQWNNYILTEINNREMDMVPDDNTNTIQANSQVQNELKVYTLYEPLLREYRNFYLKNQGEASVAINQSFFGKIMWFSDNIASYYIPIVKNNLDLKFKEENNYLISQEQFKLKYLFKALGISLPLTCLNQFFDDNDDTQDMISTGPKVKKIPNFYYNKNFSTWRPTGQMITTLYPHQQKYIERLIQTEDNQFASFDCDGGAIVWKVCENIVNPNGGGSTYDISQNWSYFPETNKPITYRNTICPVDASSFLVASRNVLYKYSTQYGPNSDSAIVKVYETEENNDITCTMGIGKKTIENQKIIFCNQDGRLNIFDQRVNKVNRFFNIPKEKGIIYCMTNSKKDDNKIYLGTLGGYIIDFDLRMNYIYNDYKYYSNTPIIGLSPYYPTKLREYDLYSMNCNPRNNNYLTVWTGALDHEIGLWNTNTLNCDILFKVNTYFDNELKPLTIEIPSITKQHNENPNAALLQCFDSLSKFTYKYNNNYIRNLLTFNVSGDFYTNSNKRLSKLKNIFEGPSTVQCVSSPFCDISFENSPFMISGGNDKIIRYWDITKEGLNGMEKKSFIVNTPCNLSTCIFSKSVYNNTTVIQSNESFNLKQPKTPKKNMPGLSEYQNYNGIAFHSFVQNEFEEDKDNLNYCTRISDASHKNLITDLLPLTIDNSDKNDNSMVLVSSSWDGTIKIWK